MELYSLQKRLKTPLEATKFFTLPLVPKRPRNGLPGIVVRTPAILMGLFRLRNRLRYSNGGFLYNMVFRPM
jgi:hypothetical protein